MNGWKVELTATCPHGYQVRQPATIGEDGRLVLPVDDCPESRRRKVLGPLIEAVQRAIADAVADGVLVSMDCPGDGTVVLRAWEHPEPEPFPLVAGVFRHGTLDGVDVAGVFEVRKEGGEEVPGTEGRLRTSEQVHIRGALPNADPVYWRDRMVDYPAFLDLTAEGFRGKVLVRRVEESAGGVVMVELISCDTPELFVTAHAEETCVDSACPFHPTGPA